MNMAAAMGFSYPDTRAKQIAGKISFLIRVRDAHLRFSKDQTMTPKARAWQAELARQADAAVVKLQAAQS